MKRITLFAAILIILSTLLGCVPTSTEIQTMTEASVLLNEKIDNVQAIIVESQVLEKEQTDKIFSEVDKVQADITKVTEAIEGREGVDAIKEGVKATSDWNPYAVPILAVINILEALGLFGLNKQKKTTKDALTEVVVGIEDGKKTKDQPGALRAATSVKTRGIIENIKRGAA